MLDILILSVVMSTIFFFLSAIVAMIIYQLLEIDSSITGILSASIVFFVFFLIFQNQIPIKEDYEKMKTELHQIKEAAVKAGIGHYKETVIETKKEFIIGTFTAELEK